MQNLKAILLAIRRLRTEHVEVHCRGFATSHGEQLWCELLSQQEHWQGLPPAAFYPRRA